MVRTASKTLSHISSVVYIYYNYNGKGEGASIFSQIILTAKYFAQ